MRFAGGRGGSCSGTQCPQAAGRRPAPPSPSRGIQRDRETAAAGWGRWARPPVSSPGALRVAAPVLRRDHPQTGRAMLRHGSRTRQGPPPGGTDPARQPTRASAKRPRPLNRPRQNAQPPPPRGGAAPRRRNLKADAEPSRAQSQELRLRWPRGTRPAPLSLALSLTRAHRRRFVRSAPRVPRAIRHPRIDWSATATATKICTRDRSLRSAQETGP